MVEKPLAPALEAADRILAAAREGGTFVQTGHVERFNQAVLAAEPYLDGPLFVESHRMAPFTPRSTDVAVVLDLMIHDVDLVMGLVGTPLDGAGGVGGVACSRPTWTSPTRGSASQRSGGEPDGQPGVAGAHAQAALLPALRVHLA